MWTFEQPTDMKVPRALNGAADEAASRTSTAVKDMVTKADEERTDDQKWALHALRAAAQLYHGASCKVGWIRRTRER